jgi:hypothetical protein
MTGVGPRRNQCLVTATARAGSGHQEAAMDPTLDVFRAIREQMDSLDDPEGAVVAVVLDFALAKAPEPESEAVS